MLAAVRDQELPLGSRGGIIESCQPARWCRCSGTRGEGKRRGAHGDAAGAGVGAGPVGCVGAARWARRGAGGVAAGGRGGGRVVCRRGEAGVGKSAVIRRFIAGLDERVRVLRGYCDPLATPRPLGPLIDMLAQLPKPEAGGLAAAINGVGAEAIYTRLLGLFADGSSWVCAMEDVHWADGATLDLLRFLARRVGTLPVLLLVSYRDDEVGRQHPLAAALGDVATCETLTRIGLDRLSRDAVAELAAGHAVNSDELHRLTGGNPFFVTEILAAGPDTLANSALPRR